jgi:ferredoxin
MANRNEKNPGNVPGPFYVDSTCIDCDLCRETAPASFRRDDELGLSIVFRQPVTPEEWQQAREALRSCPTETIGDDGSEA